MKTRARSKQDTSGTGKQYKTRHQSQEKIATYSMKDTGNKLILCSLGIIPSNVILPLGFAVNASDVKEQTVCVTTKL